MIEYRLIPLMVSVIKLVMSCLTAALTQGDLVHRSEEPMSARLAFMYRILVPLLFALHALYCSFCISILFFEVVHYDKNRSCNIYIWRK